MAHPSGWELCFPASCKINTDSMVMTEPFSLVDLCFVRGVRLRAPRKATLPIGQVAHLGSAELGSRLSGPYPQNQHRFDGKDGSAPLSMSISCRVFKCVRRESASQHRTTPKIHNSLEWQNGKILKNNKTNPFPGKPKAGIPFRRKIVIFSVLISRHFTSILIFRIPSRFFVLHRLLAAGGTPKLLAWRCSGPELW